MTLFSLQISAGPGFRPSAVTAGPVRTRKKSAWGIDFGWAVPVFSRFLTGEVPNQGALPFICVEGEGFETARGSRAAAARPAPRR